MKTPTLGALLYAFFENPSQSAEGTPSGHHQELP